VKTSSPKHSPKRPLKNQRRERVSFAQVMGSVPQRTHDQVNRRSDSRDKKCVLTMSDGVDEELDSMAWMNRLFRWCMALLLLPLCWVTSWTFLLRFSHATLDLEFWKTAEFWYFATGSLVMGGWFFSGLGKTFFLYAYVLGHEVTHAVFVLLFRGRVMDFYVGLDGGYITTNKTNLMIALSPYFVPFWSIVGAALYALTGCFSEIPSQWHRVLYAVMGFTWTFHMVWTLWMIPRDQPDLKENGTFLSLVIIYLANLFVLVGLLCIAADAPWETMRDFWLEWVKTAATGADFTYRWVNAVITTFQSQGVY
jgi:hypothetical protein